MTGRTETELAANIGEDGMSTDPEFPPNAASLYMDPENPPGVAPSATVPVHRANVPPVA